MFDTALEWITFKKHFRLKIILPDINTTADNDLKKVTYKKYMDYTRKSICNKTEIWERIKLQWY